MFSDLESGDFFFWQRNRGIARRLVPFLNQGAIFVGSSSAPQRTICTLRRLNPRRLDFILDLESELRRYAAQANPKIDAAKGQIQRDIRQITITALLHHGPSNMKAMLNHDGFPDGFSPPHPLLFSFYPSQSVCCTLSTHRSFLAHLLPLSTVSRIVVTQCILQTESCLSESE